MRVPDREGSDPKEVLAFAGLAVYHGQVLEQELILFAVMLHLSGRACVSRADVDRLFDTFDGTTLGGLLHEVRSLAAVPPGLELRLSKALSLRNDLAHRFFERHSENFISESGRVEMIDELRAASLLFQEVDAAVTGIREALSQKLGISAEMAQRELDEMVASARARDKDV